MASTRAVRNRPTSRTRTTFRASADGYALGRPSATQCRSRANGRCSSAAGSNAADGSLRRHRDGLGRRRLFRQRLRILEAGRAWRARPSRHRWGVPRPAQRRHRVCRRHGRLRAVVPAADEVEATPRRLRPTPGMACGATPAHASSTIFRLAVVVGLSGGRTTGATRASQCAPTCGGRPAAACCCSLVVACWAA